AQALHRGGGRERKHAVTSLHETSSHGERRGNDGRPEPREGDGRAHDVDDRIDCPDLVEMNGAERHVVDPRLRFGEPEEDGAAAIALFRHERALRDHVVNLGVRALGLRTVYVDVEGAGEDAAALYAPVVQVKPAEGQLR